MPSLNPLPPLEITVNIQPNAECITPLQLGNIQYQYPVGQADLPYYVTTDKISEIVVAASPIPYSRFAATYGPEPSITMQRSNTSEEPAVYSTEIKMSSFTEDPEEYFFKKPSVDGYITSTSYGSLKEGSIFNPGLFAGTPYGGAGYTIPRFDSVSVPKWADRNSSAYYPQVDFFPRYNQWFASTSWSTPFEESTLKIPKKYPITFIYVNRATKTVYYRDGFVNFRNTSQSSLGVPVPENMVDLTGGNINTRAPGNSNTPFDVTLTGRVRLSHPSLESTVWRFDLLVNDVLAASQTSTGGFPVNYTISPFAGFLGAEANKVQVKVTSLDPSPVETTSNVIYVPLTAVRGSLPPTTPL